MNLNKRRITERKFKRWVETESGGRVYTKELKGKYGWSAEYIKVVDKNEATQEFMQKVYDERGKLVEIHFKYPEDKGHKKI